MIKLIACDIDGTLIRDDCPTLAPAVLEQVERLLDKGVYFCPTSGRQYSSIRRLFAPLAGRLYCICENGGILYGPGDPGELLGRIAMERPEALALCHDILALEGYEALISGADTSYICPKKAGYESLVRDFLGNNTVVVPTPEDIPEDIVKITAYHPESARPAMQPVAAWGEKLNMAIAGELWLDFSPSHKGLGLSKLCGMLDVDLADVLAVGDSYNDLPMLDIVGHPYIMDSAAEELKQRFPDHCRRVEDLLATIDG